MTIKSPLYPELTYVPRGKHYANPVQPLHIGELGTFLGLFTTEVARRERSELRISSMPICGRRWSFGQVLPEDHQEHLISRTLLDDLRTSIGTFLHGLVQQKLGELGVLWGDWACPNCGRTEKESLGPGICSECSEQMLYEELDLSSEKLGINSGHPDGILVLSKKKFKKKRVSLLEIKTLAQEKLDLLEAPIATHHYYQGSGYSYLLKKKYGFQVESIYYLYLNRNIPSHHNILYSPEDGQPLQEVLATPSYFPASLPALAKIFRRKPEPHKFRQELVKIRSLKEVSNGRLLGPEHRICTTSSEGFFCPYSTICWSPAMDKRYG